MSYRNGYDAAVARADALQLELTRLAAENESLRNASGLVASSKPSRTAGVLAVTGGVVAAGAAVLLGIGATAETTPKTAPAPPAPADVVAVKEMTMSDLRSCALSLGSRPVLDLRAPDLEAIERTEAPCRPRLHEVARSTALDDWKRIKVEAWADAEDQLANRISLIHEYYTTPAAALETFASAPQLWNEYDLVLSSRDAMMSLALGGRDSGESLSAKR
jgi:hypothetical protein